MYRKALTYSLLIAHCAVGFALFAQGVLPPPISTGTVTTETRGAFLIGERIPKTVLVQDSNGRKRPLLTYKSPIESLVVYYLSSTCPERVARWAEVSRFYKDFKEWHVSYVVVNAGAPDSKSALAELMKKHRLDIPILDDEDRSLARAFKVGSVPFVFLIDEDAILRYRGPLGKDARQAIDALVGHITNVTHPEPLSQEECSVQ